LAASARGTRRRTTTRSRRWKAPTPGAALAFVGTIVGLVSGIAGLVFLVKPDLQPSAEAEEQAATLSQLSVKEDASFREYLARIDLPPTGYTEAHLARRGALLRFRVRISGFEGERLVLKWELFDAGSGEQVNESKATTLRASRGTNEANWHFWVPLPRREGTFYAIVELQQQQEHHALALDTLQTDPFPGLGQPP
jgi:hypothetical protein